jgi:hypothetical protein
VRRRAPHRLSQQPLRGPQNHGHDKGAGGAAYWFDLKSECVNGRYAYIRVKAGGFGAGFGAKLTGCGSGVTFDGGLSDIFPDGFTGIFRVLGVNAGIGLVGGWTWYQVGNNFSDIGGAPSPALVLLCH